MNANRVSAEQLNAIKERAEKVTLGPWELDTDDNGIWNKGGKNYLGQVTLSTADAKFIAASREDIPQLVAEVERLRDGIETIQERLFSVRGLNGTHDGEITGACIAIRKLLEGDDVD